jgi:type IV pilus assembly protein PilE
MRAGARTSLQGVTLVELLVAVVVIAIFVAIGIPAYQQYGLRVRRSDATRELLSMAGRLERCFTRTGDYRRADDAPNPCLKLPFTTPDGTYTIAFATAPTASEFELVATPQGEQAADARCANFSINQTGLQGVTGSSTPQVCWAGRALQAAADRFGSR